MTQQPTKPPTDQTRPKPLPIGQLLDEQEAMQAISSELGHNEIRFDLCLAYIYPMVADGDVDLAKLVGKIRGNRRATFIGKDGSYTSSRTAEKS